MGLVRVDPRTNDIVSGFLILGTGFARKMFFAMGLTWTPKIWSGLDPARVSETYCHSGMGLIQRRKTMACQEHILAFLMEVYLASWMLFFLRLLLAPSLFLLTPDLL